MLLFLYLLLKPPLKRSAVANNGLFLVVLFRRVGNSNYLQGTENS